MRKRIRQICVCLFASLLWSNTALAEHIVTPNPMGSTSSEGAVTPSQNTPNIGPGGPMASSPLGQVKEVVTVSEPQIQAEGAALYNVNTGQFLYGKNLDTKFYPASITKLMTALLVLERTNMDDTVTYSSSAVNNLEWGSVSLGLVAGDTLSVKDSLYGLLLKSANEVANGLAEHVAGSVSGFCDLMNERARALGCTNTNFENPNGLNHSNHVTSPRDMAIIAAEAFKNPTLCQISSTLSYQIPATKKAEARNIIMGHKMLYPSDSRYYSGIIGGKTGYTSLAGNTLVTCAEKNGVRLIAVVLKSKATHYNDTKALLDYGFSNPDSGAASGKWIETNGEWTLQLADGTKAKDCFMKVNGRFYGFNSDGYMETGWKELDNGDWYYFKSSGAMAQSCWVEVYGKWYYLGENGVLLKNTTTPDGYRVDENGVWI